MIGEISIQSTTSQQPLLDCVPAFFAMAAAALDEAVTPLDGMPFDSVRRLKKRRRIIS